jgi:O-antigen/teichoic acid export membrane protein
MTPSSDATSSQPVDVAGNASAAMFGKALYLVTRLGVPPLVLAHISLAEYGLWTACFVLIMYVGLTDVGFSNVYVRFTARYHAARDVDSINRLLSTGIITLSGMAMAVLAGIWLALPLVLDFLGIDPLYREKANILVLGTTGMFLLDLTLGAYCYLLHGLQQIVEEQKVAIAGYLLELVLIFAFLNADFGVYALLMAFTLRYTWSLLSFRRLAHRFLPDLQIRPRHFDRQMLHHFFGFGAKVQASALLATALFSIDRVLAGFLLGPKGIALFELAAKLPVSALAIPSAISNVTLATAARHAAEHKAQAIRDLHQQATRSVSLLAAFPLGFMATFAAPIGKAWLSNGSDLHDFPLIMTLSTLAAHLHVTTGPGSAVLRATGRAGNEFVYHGLRFGLLALFVTLGLAVMPSIVQGLACGLSVGAAAAAATYLVVNQRVLAMPVRPLLSHILLPGMLAYAMGGVLRLTWEGLVPAAISRWETLACLAVVATLYTAAYALIGWRWLLTPPERARLDELRGKFAANLLRGKRT